MDSAKKKRIIIVAGGGITLLLLSIIVFGLIFGGDSIEENLTEIAQRQEEIIRIADIGKDKGRSQQALSAASTTSAAISSSRQAVVDAVAARGIKLNRKVLQARINAQTTIDLDAAEQANQFDAVFLKTLGVEIRAYQNVLQTTYDRAKLASDKMLLESLYDESLVILNAVETE